jgi:hypothetical protein
VAIPAAILARRAAGVLFVLLAGGACDDAGPDGAFRPTDPTLLSTGSPTKDEDPSVVRAADGRLFVAWFSDRGANPDIYVTSRAGGTDWTAPVRVTNNPGGDFNPHLIQDEQGVFHLTWFRWTAPSVGHIWYNSSADGRTWDPGTEVQVTTADAVDDWVPTIARAADGTLVICFVSEVRDPANRTSELYVAVRRPGATDWDPATALTAVNSPTEHDHLPFAARIGNEIRLVWVRYDTSKPLPWENPESDLFAATSADGLAWSAATRVTDEPGSVVNLFPMLYADEDGLWSYLWLSGRSGTPRVFERDVTGAPPYPQGVRERDELPAGYSHRIVPTSTPGVYLGVWVQGPEGAQDIYYRFFER